MTTSPTPAADWIDFKVGSPCPVLLEERVEVRLRNGQSRQDQAGALRWSARDDTDGYDILAYRVVSPTPASAANSEAIYEALREIHRRQPSEYDAVCAIIDAVRALQPSPPVADPRFTKGRPERGCYCSIRCAAPRIMGRQTPCLRLPVALSPGQAIGDGQ